MSQMRRKFLNIKSGKRLKTLAKVVGIGLGMSLWLNTAIGGISLKEDSNRMNSVLGVAYADDLEILTAEEIYDLISENVFYLRVYQKDGSLKTVGTGFLLEDGRALTAAHVVEGGATFEASFVEKASDKPKTYFSKLIKISKENDIAVLELQGLPDSWAQKGRFSKSSPTDSSTSSPNGLSLKEQSTEDTKYGQTVYALGYPLKDTKVITQGIINAPEANLSGKIRLLASATVAPGMSGGPLVNDRGELVGLISGSTKTMNEMHVIVPLKIIKTVIGGQ